MNHSDASTDIVPPHSGAGGRSVYGGLFADECFTIPHDQPGLVVSST